MKQKLRLGKMVIVAAMASFMYGANAYGQTYTWSGSASNQFYNTSNWTSSDGPVVFDNSAFKIVRTNTQGQSPVIGQWIDWQPGIYDNLGGNLTLNADFQVYFNDFLNGNVTINSAASFICRNIIRVGREGSGTVNINGGTMRSLHETNWQGIFIGVLQNGNGTVNVNDGGLISGGYQVEVGTRDFYPTGVLNVNAGGTSEAYWNTVIGPNGIINVNGGTVNTGQGFIVGDLYLDTPANTGTLGTVVGQMNLNEGTVTVNHLDLASPNLAIHANGKIVIDNGTLRVRRTGVDFTATINGYVATGQIAPAAGKELQVAYDGTEFTTVVATAINNTQTANKAQIVAFPNPASDKLFFKGVDNNKISIMITDVTGKVVLNANGISNISAGIDISALTNGVYVAKVANGNAVQNIKFIKK